MPYTWLSLNQAVSALQGRLANVQFWTAAECQRYIFEALRTWNALTETQIADFTFNSQQATTWYNMATQANSPRLRTLTDTDIYTDIEYALLEPPTGSTWTGTSQFSLSMLQYTLQHRRDELIQASGCNIVQIPSLASTPNVRRTNFPDNVLEPMRARFVPAAALPPSATIPPITLTREDMQVFDDFEPDHLQTDAMPESWSVVSGPPLSMDVDTAPNVPGTFDVLTLQSGIPFNPPGSTLLGVPDDWAHLCKWGALADLLGRESEATDRARAAYCLQRFTEGIKIMRESNWLLKATINNVPADTPSLFEQDSYAPEWELDSSAWPAIVTAGMDFFAVCPLQSAGVGVTMVGNAYIPPTGDAFVQCSRDVFDVILGYAQHVAAFKEGGEEFQSTQNLLDDFYRAAKETNKRIEYLGIYTDVLQSQGKREDSEVPRW